MSAPACVACGLCLTGCPYGLIYSASQTLTGSSSGGRSATRTAARTEGRRGRGRVLGRDARPRDGAISEAPRRPGVAGLRRPRHDPGRRELDPARGHRV